MEYSMPDGSQFSLRPVWKTDANGDVTFDYTTVSAYVDGVAYHGKIDDWPEDADEGDVLESLHQRVPAACIHPLLPDGCTLAPPFDAAQHFLKAPSFTYEDCQPGCSFVADCVLNEVTVLESFRNQHAPPAIVKYHGVQVDNGRITHVCLERYPHSLVDYIDHGLSVLERTELYEQVRSGMEWLHSLGLAHNDIKPDNICVTSNGQPAIIDFDGCLPFGEPLMKGSARPSSSPYAISAKENDLGSGLQSIRDILWLNDEDSQYLPSTDGSNKTRKQGDEHETSPRG